jgi:hypothetical protein
MVRQGAAGFTDDLPLRVEISREAYLTDDGDESHGVAKRQQWSGATGTIRVTVAVSLRKSKARG